MGKTEVTRKITNKVLAAYGASIVSGLGLAVTLSNPAMFAVGMVGATVSTAVIATNGQKKISEIERKYIDL